MERIKSVDPAAKEILKVSSKKGYETVWDRLEAQEPQCGFGELGICCRNCVMGPCRIDPFGEGPDKGVCGATADTIVARNIVRMIAAGAAAHSDHGRRPALLLKEVGEKKNKDYTVKDENKLKAVAMKLGIDTKAKDKFELADAVASVALNDFGKQTDEPLEFLNKYAPVKLKEKWKSIEDTLYKNTGKIMGVIPRSIDREIVDIMHRTHIGVDNEPLSLILQGIRAALGDGWGGSLIATECQDILFGTPSVHSIEANLGVLSQDEVNIVIHGHEPVLSEKIVEAASHSELVNYAKSKGAKGINIAGMCCTGNEILMRHNVPIAGNELHQELAVITGAVDAMVVDVQCIFPALANLTKCFHTKFISTSDQAGFPGALHIQFEEQHADEIAERIIKTAIDNYPNRDAKKVNIPNVKENAIAGFSTERILEALGGSPKPLVDAIVAGKIKGIAGIVGCNNPKVTQDSMHIELAKELIKRDILVIGTGCWAIALAKAGLLSLEASELAGSGLKEVCAALKIPPFLHMGSCVDCSRMLVLAGAVADFLKVDISDLPLFGSAPEWMTEKAVSIGTYFVASGVPVHLWPVPPIMGSKEVVNILTVTAKEVFGGYFIIEEDVTKAVDIMEKHIVEKRKKLVGE
jgi:carbon-monoxide dehydrogenase catalytic subunit